MVPNSFTGKREVDSTFVCASSATCVCRISTGAPAGAADAPALQRVDFGAQPLDLGPQRRQLTRDILQQVLRRRLRRVPERQRDNRGNSANGGHS